MTLCRRIQTRVSIISESNIFRQGQVGLRGAELRAQKVHHRPHLVSISGSLDRGFQVSHGAAGEHSAAADVRRQEVSVGEHGVCGGHQELAVLEPDKNPPILQLLPPVVENRQRRLEPVRLVGQVGLREKRCDSLRRVVVVRDQYAVVTNGLSLRERGGEKAKNGEKRQEWEQHRRG